MCPTPTGYKPFTGEQNVSGTCGTAGDVCPACATPLPRASCLVAASRRLVLAAVQIPSSGGVAVLRVAADGAEPMQVSPCERWERTVASFRTTLVMMSNIRPQLTPANGRTVVWFLPGAALIGVFTPVFVSAVRPAPDRSLHLAHCTPFHAALECACIDLRVRPGRYDGRLWLRWVC